MKRIIFVLFLMFIAHILEAQNIGILNGKWAFSGSRLTLFHVKNDSLFFTEINDHIVKDFEPFYSGSPDFSSLTLFPCKVFQFNEQLMITTEVSKKRLFTFIYSLKDTTIIHFVGDVYYNDKRSPNPNENCDLNVPYCTIKLYSINEIITIRNLKAISEISKKEVMKVFKQHSKLCKTKCNKCYEGFPGAEVNQIIIEMGYNPICKIPRNDSYTYQTSGFDNIMDIYKSDKEIYSFYKKYFLDFINNK